MKLINPKTYEEIDVYGDEIVQMLQNGYVPKRNFYEMITFTPEGEVEF